MSKSNSKTKSGSERRRQPAKGRRFTAEQREHALVLVVAGMKRVAVAKAVGTTVESLRRWVQTAEAEGRMPQAPGEASAPSEVDVQGSTNTDSVASAIESEPVVAQPSPAPDATPSTTASSSSPPSAASSQPAAPPTATAPTASPFAPKDPGQGLSGPEEEGILMYKRKHPSMGPAQIRAQLKRFKGWRLSVKAITRVLRHHGYEPVHLRGRPQGPEPIRFEAPRPNALWQADFAELRVGGERRYVLVVIDDFSRFCVGHILSDSPSAEAAMKTLGAAIARHGKPETVRTDRGGAFQSKEYRQYLESQLIDQMMGRSYHPEGGGKVESLVGTIRRELWEVEHFDDFDIASRRLERFLRDYNERRAHMGIDGLTPADRYFGRAEQVLALLDAVSRKRQGAFAQQGAAELFEEITSGASRAPMEVLRLVIVDGQMELRLCGARVALGTVTTG